MNFLIIVFVLISTLSWADVTGVKRVVDLNRNTTPNVLDVTYCADVSDTSGNAAGTDKKCRISDLFKAGDITVDGTNTGVGTIAPTTKLDVVGTVKATAFIGNGSGLTGVAASASDTAYSSAWDGDTTGIASKNALYDKFETVTASGGGWQDNGTFIQTITLTDNVGIGTTTEEGILTVGKNGIAGELINKGWEDLNLTPEEGTQTGIGFSEVNSFGIHKEKLYIGYDLDGNTSNKFIPIYTWDGKTYERHSYLGGGEDFEGVTFLQPYQGILYAGQQSSDSDGGDVWYLDESDTDWELVFNGSDASSLGDAYVVVPNDSSNNAIFGATAFSVEWKGKITGVGESSGGRIIDKLTLATSLNGYRLYLDSSKRLNFSITEGGTNKVTTTSDTISYGVDTHVVVTWATGASPKIYINGVEASYTTSTAVTTPSDDTANTLTIGNINGGTTRAYAGFMRLLRLYRGVELTSGNVTTLYGGTEVGGDTAEYLFNEGTGTTLTDSSGNSNNGTISNARWNRGHWVMTYDDTSENFSYSATVFKGKLIVGTGYTNPATVLSYDGNTWSTVLTSTGTGLVVGLYVYKGRLYVGTGGTNSRIISTDDLVTWTVEADYPNTTYTEFNHFIEFRGKLYVNVIKASGSPAGNDILIRDDATGTWSVVYTMPDGAQGWGMDVYNDVLYIGNTISGTIGAKIYKSFDGINFEEDIQFNTDSNSHDWEAFKFINYNGSLYVGTGSSTTVGAGLWRKTASLGQQFDSVNQIIEGFRLDGTEGLHKTVNDRSMLSVSFPTSFDAGIRSGVNWQYITGDITQANWISIAPYLNRGAINWTDANLYTGGATGNIGINNGAPSEKLEVTGTVKATAFVGDGSLLTGIAGGTSGWTTDSSSKTTTTYNVGVGSVNPTQALDVNGVVKASSFQSSSSAAGVLQLYEASANGSNYINWVSPDSLAANVQWILPIAQGTAGQALALQTAATGQLNWQDFPAGTSQWTTQNTTDVSLAGGNVGIGTTATTKSALTIMNGNVGIGTWIPRGNLNVVSTPGTSDIITVGGNVGIGTISGTVSKLFVVKNNSNFSVDNNGTLTLAGQLIGNGNGLTVSSSSAVYTGSSSTAGSTLTVTGGASTTSLLNLRSTSNASGSGDGIRFIAGTGPTEVARFAGKNLGIGTNTPVALLNISSTAAQNLFAVDDNGPGDTTPFIIDSTGNVGIGTTVPADYLTIFGGGITIKETDDFTRNAIVASSSSTGGLFQVYGSGTTTIRMGSGSNYINTSGNFGLGLNSPINKLDVEGGVAIGAAYSGNVTAPTDGAIIVGNTGIGTHSPLSLLDINRKLNVFSDGNVGIGSITPGQVLDVTGTVRATAFSGNGSGQALIGSNAGIGLDGANLSASSPTLIVATTGNIGIGSLSPGTALDVVGNVRVSGIGGSSFDILCRKADKTIGVCGTAVVGVGCTACN